MSTSTVLESTPPSAVAREVDCPRCGHDNLHVVHPTYSRLIALLRFPQRRPYCDVASDSVSGFAAEPGCGCKAEYHASIF